MLKKYRITIRFHVQQMQEYIMNIFLRFYNCNILVGVSVDKDVLSL
jgi:hypothetical protein